jgi:protein SCO1/2
MKAGVLLFWGLLMLALAGLYGWRMHDRNRPIVGAAMRTDAVDGPELKRVVDFLLIDQNGKPVKAEDLHGKVWIAAFFFSNCPAACLTLNQTLAKLQKELPDFDVKVVSITVDPEHDTPQRLREYAARFGADSKRWKFLTGPMDEIKRLAADSFQVAAAPGVHTDRFMLVDRDGMVRGSYRGGEEAQLAALKRKANELLKEAS